MDAGKSVRTSEYIFSTIRGTWNTAKKAPGQRGGTRTTFHLLENFPCHSTIFRGSDAHEKLLLRPRFPKYTYKSAENMGSQNIN